MPSSISLSGSRHRNVFLSFARLGLIVFPTIRNAAARTLPGFTLKRNVDRSCEGDDSCTTFANDATAGNDSFAQGPRTGNWTKLTCSDPAIQGMIDFTPQERWGMLDGANAWSDIINVWFKYDQGTGFDFTESVFNTMHGSENANCGLQAPQGSCLTTDTCAAFAGFGSGGSGPVSYEIYNSFVYLNSMYSELHGALVDEVALYIDNQLPSFETTFAPVPPPASDQAMDILIALLGLGITAIAAPFFDGVMEGLPAIAALSSDAGSTVIKDVTYAAISFGASIAVDAIPPAAPGHWKPKSQKSFSAYLGKVVRGWSLNIENQLWSLFNGSSQSVDLLGKFLANGTFLEGKGGAPNITRKADQTEDKSIEGFVGRAFFGFAIPALWTTSGAGAFIIDSGYPCSAQSPLDAYMTSATEKATRGCYENQLYYLVHPKGEFTDCGHPTKPYGCDDCDPHDQPLDCVNSQFEAPAGLGTLGVGKWGGVTLADLIEGSVRTYNANNHVNGGPIADPLNSDTLADLQNRDITTPGYIRLPVCSVEVAWASWSHQSQSNASAPNYPCNPLQGKTKCSAYTYQDETSSASPKVSDCQAIVKNIQGTGGDWTTGISGQRDIASYGSCHFGVQATRVSGDVTFYTGSQDIVNIINESVQKYTSNGYVGAKGYMSCGGDAGSQNVTWGLY